VEARIKRAYAPQELVEMLGLSRGTIYALLAEGRIRSVRVGRRIVVPSEAVDEFLRSEEAGGNPAA
jgi:excisionase family DNA binding protein